MSNKASKGTWFQRFLNKLLLEQSIKKIEMMGDNKTSLTLMKDSESQNCIKHINVIYYDIQGFVEDRELKIE